MAIVTGILQDNFYISGWKKGPVQTLRYCFLVFLQFITLASFGATLVVTSNADSGPGTLRQALLDAAANGTTDKDYITFNLPDVSEAGRTIGLVTILPDLTSNLIIDGSTQPGATFGQSDAHVKIATPSNYIIFTVFNGSNIADVDFYGLYIYDYSGTNTSRPDLKARNGIILNQSTNIIFGGIGKGNLIRGFNNFSISLTNVNFVSFKSNVIGLGKNNDFDNEESIRVYDYTGNINLRKCNNILIGGNLGEANTMFTGFNILFEKNSLGNIVDIKSNNLNIFQDGKTISFLDQDVTPITIGTEFLNVYDANERLNGADVSINIENNLSGNFRNAVVVTGLKGHINFYNNFFGISRDGLVDLNVNSRPHQCTCIRISGCSAQINIGDPDLSKSNFLANSIAAIDASTSPNVFIRGNVYQCLSSGVYNVDAITAKINITKFDNSNSSRIISGTADPGATIDIYSSESCSYAKCSIRAYITTVNADNNGNWNSGGLNFNGIFYASATIGQRTSQFKTFEINKTNINIQSMRCTNTATITGLTVPQGLSYYWIDSRGNIVSRNLDLITQIAGDYRLVLADGCIVSDLFHIIDNRVSIYDAYTIKKVPSCGNADGSFKNLSVYDPLNKISSKVWTNSSGVIVSTTLDLANLAAGNYTLTIRTSDGCTVTYNLPMVSANAPRVDQSSAIIASTPCGQSGGSIIGITATGTGNLKYSWKNEQNVEVSTNKDLVGQPGGKYILQVSDETNCGAVFSSAIVIPEINGVIIDESLAAITPVICNNDGAIKGIKINNALRYEWKDALNNTAGTTLDLINVKPGNYYLLAYNNSCSKQSKIYTVTQTVTTAFAETKINVTNSCLNGNTGTISTSITPAPTAYRWVSLTSGLTVGNEANIKNLIAGDYNLYLTNSNGCENIFKTYTVGSYKNFEIITKPQVLSATCGFANGSSIGLQVIGGLPPYTYSWLNSSDKQIASTPDVNNLPAGIYTLKITDAAGCGTISTTIVVNDDQEIIAAPAVASIQICAPGETPISAINPTPNIIYRIYNDASDQVPIQELLGGKFKLSVKATSSYYISQLNGTCESSRAEVAVTVGLSGTSIASTFTPNGDGINDYWQIKGIENYSDSRIKIFNRSGQNVFNSIGYNHPFDGTFNGALLPTGTYYYIISFRTGCSLLSGNLTIIR